MTSKKRFPCVFVPNRPMFRPNRTPEMYPGAPTSEYQAGHIYFLTEAEIGEFPWFRFADSFDLRHRVLHRSATD